MGIPTNAMNCGTNVASTRKRAGALTITPASRVARHDRMESSECGKDNAFQTTTRSMLLSLTPLGRVLRRARRPPARHNKYGFPTQRDKHFVKVRAARLAPHGFDAAEKVYTELVEPATDRLVRHVTRARKLASQCPAGSAGSGNT
jgi:hypothetical protein